MCFKNRMALTAALLVTAAVQGSQARADLMPIGPAAFPAGSPLLTFAGLADGTEVNGLTVAGVTFRVTRLGLPQNGAVIIDGGPGVTNNIAPPNIVSITAATGLALDVELPTEATQFGFGYAILATVPVANAATVELFNGTTSLGSLSYNGVPDPTFTGGFAGVQSTIPFDRARLAFSPVAPAFAVDNIRFSAQAVPEPSSLGLAAMGSACGFAVLARQRRRRL